MAESAEDLLKRLKPRHRRLTASGHTAQPKPAAKPATKKASAE